MMFYRRNIQKLHYNFCIISCQASPLARYWSAVPMTARASDEMLEVLQPSFWVPRVARQGNEGHEAALAK